MTSNSEELAGAIATLEGCVSSIYCNYMMEEANTIFAWLESAARHLKFDRVVESLEAQTRIIEELQDPDAIEALKCAASHPEVRKISAKRFQEEFMKTGDALWIDSDQDAEEQEYGWGVRHLTAFLILLWRF